MPRRFEKGQGKREREAAAPVQLEELKIEYLPIDKLKANDYNPNRQSDFEFELLCRSIQEDGFTQPVLAAQDLTIIDGEHRWRAAKHVGLEEIPVVVMPMEAAQARIATLRHNRARGQEDLDLSAAVLRDLERLGAIDWAQDSLMLSPEEVERLLQAPEPEDYPEVQAVSPDLEPGKRAANDMTPATIAKIRQAEVDARRNRTREEKELGEREPQPWRLYLTFSDEEADIVRSVLGESPAANLLQLCRDEAARKEEVA